MLILVKFPSLRNLTRLQVILGMIFLGVEFSLAQEFSSHAQHQSQSQASEVFSRNLIGEVFSAHDTLSILDETQPDAIEALQALSWKPEDFQVQITAPIDAEREDCLIRFPSPRPGLIPESHQVVMELKFVRNQSGEIIKAPAAVIVHESGRGMTVGRLIAKGLHQRGVHAFLLQLPGYGQRRGTSQLSKSNLLQALDQGIADVRRARDAVVALPFVANDRVTLQGTSLGGFVSSTVAGLDQGYHRVFLLLSGGDIHEVIEKGQRDAQAVRDALREAGLTDEDIRIAARRIEPNRLAHRLSPDRTWLHAGVLDQVVPIANSRSFAKAANLNAEHYIEMPVDHFAGIIFLPGILDQIAAVTRDLTLEELRTEVHRVPQQQ